jgi:hypothetical protein
MRSAISAGGSQRISLTSSLTVASRSTTSENERDDPAHHVLVDAGESPRPDEEARKARLGLAPLALGGLVQLSHLRRLLLEGRLELPPRRVDVERDVLEVAEDGLVEERARDPPLRAELAPCVRRP